MEIPVNSVANYVPDCYGFAAEPCVGSPSTGVSVEASKPTNEVPK
jgi:hypothetical protein